MKKKIQYLLPLFVMLIVTVPIISLISFSSYIIIAPLINLQTTHDGKVFSMLIPTVVASPVNVIIFTLYYHLRKKRHELADAVSRLEAALSEVREIQGIIPICSYCHKIRDEGEVWNRLEQYISSRTKALFSHGICPECARELEEADLDN